MTEICEGLYAKERFELEMASRFGKLGRYLSEEEQNSISCTESNYLLRATLETTWGP